MTFDDFFIDARTVFTALSLFTFLGIVAWAYSSSRK